MANAVTQFQIVSKAPDEAASFYSALFDWKVDANNPIGYRRIDTRSTEGIQGGIWPAPPQASTFVQLFVTVPDVKAAIARAMELARRRSFRRPPFRRARKWRSCTIRKGCRSELARGFAIVDAPARANRVPRARQRLYVAQFERAIETRVRGISRAASRPSGRTMHVGRR
jgi:hypothetical protein